MTSSDVLNEDSMILFNCPEICQYIPTEIQHLLDIDTDCAGIFCSTKKWELSSQTLQIF